MNFPIRMNICQQLCVRKACEETTIEYYVALSTLSLFCIFAPSFQGPADAMRELVQQNRTVKTIVLFIEYYGTNQHTSTRNLNLKNGDKKFHCIRGRLVW